MDDINESICQRYNELRQHGTSYIDTVGKMAEEFYYTSAYMRMKITAVFKKTGAKMWTKKRKLEVDDGQAVYERAD